MAPGQGRNNDTGAGSQHLVPGTTIKRVYLASFNLFSDCVFNYLIYQAPASPYSNHVFFTPERSPQEMDENIFKNRLFFSFAKNFVMKSVDF